jgi:nucleosome assembly protein 1-like 1
MGTAAAGDIAKLLQNPAELAQMVEAVESEKFVMNLPTPVKRRVQALKKLQLEAVKIEADFYKRVHDLECQFADKFQVLNGKRKNIVNGDYEPDDTEADFPLIGPPDLTKELAEKVSLQNGPEKAESEEEKSMGGGDSANVKGIPEFWLTLLKNVELIAEMIQEHDQPILQHLRDLDVELYKPPDHTMGFKLIFHFAANDFFTNATLTKEYTLRCDPDENEPFEFDGPEIISCSGSKIDWKTGKNVTVKMIKKKQKHKQKGATRFVTKEVKNDSFFNFFDPPEIPEGNPETMDEETRDLLNADFEIGQILRDRIVPRAVLYFTDEAHDDSFDEDEDEEFEEDEDLEEDDEEDDGQVP